MNTLLPCSHLEKMAHISHKEIFSLNWVPIKDTLKVFEGFKSNVKIVWSNVSWCLKVTIFWKFIQYTIHWDQNQMLKKFPWDNRSVTKNALFIVLLSFRDSYMGWIKFYHSKSMCWIFYFRFWFVFIKVSIFFQQEAWTL